MSLFDSAAGIGIVGAGDLGAAVANLCVRAGIGVTLASRRGPPALAPLIAELGPRARAASIERAAASGALVVLAVPFGSHPTLPVAAFRDRIVIDAANWFGDRDGPWDALFKGRVTSSEVLGAHLDGARIVKAFNTLSSSVIVARADRAATDDDRLAMLVASDDDEAKGVAGAWLTAIGLGVVDTGSLRAGGRLQAPGSHVFNRPMTVARARRALTEDRWVLSIAMVGGGDEADALSVAGRTAGLAVAHPDPSSAAAVASAVAEADVVVLGGEPLAGATAFAGRVVVTLVGGHAPAHPLHGARHVVLDLGGDAAVLDGDDPPANRLVARWLRAIGMTVAETASLHDRPPARDAPSPGRRPGSTWK